MKKIIPAILSDDIQEVKYKIGLVESFAEWVQIDVMDGTLAENNSVTFDEFSTIQFDLKLEAHMMVSKPLMYVEKAKDMRFSRFIFHVESEDDPAEVINEIGSFGMESGIAISPGTSLDEIEPYVRWIDVVLFLGVEPGFGGQEFMPEVLEKIKAFRKEFPEKIVAVDGGVNLETIEEIKNVGADLFAVGTGLYGADDVKARYEEIENKVK